VQGWRTAKAQAFQLLNSTKLANPAIVPLAGNTGNHRQAEVEKLGAS